MTNFDILLIDADDTLLDYPADSSAALARLLKTLDREWTPAIEELYQSFNQAAWRRLERGEITKPQLQLLRFEQFFAALGIDADPEQSNRIYMEELANGGRLLPGALELCRELASKVSLFIITNGTAPIQRSRLPNSGLLPYLKKIYISDELGVQKPQTEFFDTVLADIRLEYGAFDMDRVLVFGDSLTSDMLGGIRSGLKTCWYNPEGKSAKGLPIDHIVTQYNDLKRLVLNETAE